MIKAVIFDLDGLLYDSEPVHAQATGALLKKHGVEYKKTLDELYGRRVIDGMQILKDKFNLPGSVQQLFAQRDAIFLVMLGKVKLMPGFVDLKKAVDRLNLKKALATSGHKSYVDILLKKDKLDNYFDSVITGDMVEKGKPEPEIYLKTAKALSVAPTDCLVLEDSPIGLQAAKAAGMKCIIVPNPDTKHLNFSQADQVVNSLADINLDYIKQI